MLVPLPVEMAPGTIVAHRGNRVAERENTTAAFRSARAVGAAAVELDVRRTKDQQLVVHHDAAVEDLGLICDMGLAELRSGAPWVPTLRDALDACDGMWVNVEIKNSDQDPDWDPQRTTAGLLDIDPTGIIVSSFDWPSADAARDAGFTGALLVADSPIDAIAYAGTAGHRSVNVQASLLAEEAATDVVAAAAAANVWVMVWTVNDPDEANRLKAAGVNAIMTDDPARILSATNRP